MSQSTPNPTAALVIIGSEILSGRTADANLNHIARKLSEAGIPLKDVRVVADDEAAIVEAVNLLRAKHTYLFTTGGIGPTHDDITMAAIAKAFAVPLERNARVEAHLKQHYGNRATAATFRMADYPFGSEQVWHTDGFAPGCRIENVFVLAGQPRVMQTMLDAALPLLQPGAPIHTRSVDVWTSESLIAEGLAGIQSRYPEVEVGSYPYRIEGRAGTALVARGTDAAAVEKAHEAILRLVDEVGAELRAA
jgi:molybdopterin-biosynthesis enzyme MoeA-like protein